MWAWTPILGTDQSQGTYWTIIHDYFHANKTFESNRTGGSLMNCWSCIQHDVNVFCGCVSRTEARNHSGWSVDDKIANACTLFKAEDKKQRKFAYMHCWRILKDKPMWLERWKQVGSARKKNKQQETKSNGKFVSFIICTWNSTCTHPCCWWWWWTDGEPPGRPMLKRRSRSYDNIQPWKQWTILLSNG